LKIVTKIDYISGTIGIDFKTKIIKIDNGIKVKLQIWDTNSIERLRSFYRKYYKGTDGIILAYDITDRNSFEKLDYCFNDIIYCYSKYIPIFLIGNKIDKKDRREITFAEGEEFSKKHGFMFCECSAKTGENIDFIFNKLANEINPEEEERKKRKLEVEKELQKFAEEPKRFIEEERKRIESEEKQKKICDNLLKYLFIYF
jgi:small GTP-binding protein